MCLFEYLLCLTSWKPIVGNVAFKSWIVTVNRTNLENLQLQAYTGDQTSISLPVWVCSGWTFHEMEIVKYFSYDIKIDGTVSPQDKSDNYYELDK